MQEKAVLDWGARGGVEVIMQPHELNVSGGTIRYGLGDNRRLVANEQAAIVREVFERRADGETWGRPAD